jgi:hypothetical protein
MRYYISEDNKKFELVIYRVDEPTSPPTSVARFVARKNQSSALRAGIEMLVAELNQIASIMPEPGPGTFETAAGARASIVCAQDGYLKGDLAGVGPTLWGYDGRHIYDTRLDLVRRVA